MANEQQIEALEQAKKLAQEKVSEIEQSLLTMKHEAALRLKEIDEAIANAKKVSTETIVSSEPVSLETVVQPIVEEKNKDEEKPQVEPEYTQSVVETPKPIDPIIEEQPVQEKKEIVAEKPKVQDKKHVESNIKKSKKEEEKERVNKLLKSRKNEKELINELKLNLAKRAKGDKPAEPGNTGIKHTNAEVYIYIIDDNALQLKVLLEKFKTTKSFKIAKGFSSGEECLNYIKKHRYSKNSMIMTVVDYYLDDKGNGEESNTGIDVLNMLKDYDSDIEVIVLSGSDDVDIAASATHFGAISFVKKGEDDFKKIVNNIVWAIHEKAKLRKKADTQKMIKIMAICLIGFSIISILSYSIWYYLEVLKYQQP